MSKKSLLSDINRDRESLSENQEAIMTAEQVMANIEQYDKSKQDAIRLAVTTASGEVLEAMLAQIVEDK